MFKLKRIGTQKVKVLFSIEVQSIAFPPMKDVREGSLVSVCFERGGKMVTSQDRAVVSAAGPMKGDMRVEIKETLRLVATLYRKGDHTHHTYQEKTGKLTVRQRQKDGKSKHVYKGIGTALLNLHSVAESFEPTKLTLVLEQCSTYGVVLHAKITAKILGDAGDDTMSQMSGMTDVSCGAAEFDPGAALGGIEEETDGELTHEARRTSFIASDTGRPSSPNVLDRILKTSDASKILGTKETRQQALAAPPPPPVEQKLSSRASSEGDPFDDERDTILSKGDIDLEHIKEPEDDGTSRNTFSMKNNMPFISQTAYDDKIKEIRYLQLQLNELTAEASRGESKLATANMLLNAETKRSKKLKSELVEANKQRNEAIHKLSVFEKQKEMVELKAKGLESDNERMRLLLSTQRDLTEAATDRHVQSREPMKSILDQKIALVSVQDELQDVKADRDVYKTECEELRAELSYLRNDLLNQGVYIPPKEERTDEDKADMIAALRTQLSSFQEIAEEEKTTLMKKREAVEQKYEKMKQQLAARESELKSATVTALAVAKDSWERERAEFVSKINSMENHREDMIKEVNELRYKLQAAEAKLSTAEAERAPSPSPAPSRSVDEGSGIMKPLSRMKSIKASLMGESSKQLLTTSEAADYEKQIENLNAEHRNAVTLLTKELDALRGRMVILETELDQTDQRLLIKENELKATKMELWELLDRVDEQADVNKAPAERTVSLRASLSSMSPSDANSILLEQLITLKMEYAQLAIKKDQDRLETFELKKRVHNYAERVAMLEVQLALSDERSKDMNGRF